MMRTPTFALVDKLLDSWVAGEDLDGLSEMSWEIWHEVEEDMRKEGRRWMRCREYGMLWVSDGKRRQKAA